MPVQTRRQAALAAETARSHRSSNVSLTSRHDNDIYHVPEPPPSTPIHMDRGFSHPVLQPTIRRGVPAQPFQDPYPPEPVQYPRPDRTGTPTRNDVPSYATPPATPPDRPLNDYHNAGEQRHAQPHDVGRTQGLSPIGPARPLDHDVGVRRQTPTPAPTAGPFVGAGQQNNVRNGAPPPPPDAPEDVLAILQDGAQWVAAGRVAGQRMDVTNDTVLTRIIDILAAPQRFRVLTWIKIAGAGTVAAVVAFLLFTMRQLNFYQSDMYVPVP